MSGTSWSSWMKDLVPKKRLGVYFSGRSRILQMTALGLGQVEDFPFVDPPDRRAVRDGVVERHPLHGHVQFLVLDDEAVGPLDVGQLLVLLALPLPDLDRERPAEQDRALVALAREMKLKRLDVVATCIELVLSCLQQLIKACQHRVLFEFGELYDPFAARNRTD